MIYLLHIPKTGGTSIQALLSRYAARNTLRVVGPCLVDDLVANGCDDWTSADILHGHLGTLPMQKVPDAKIITILRHPASHLHSWYRHVVWDPNHYFHEPVTRLGLSFADWLDWPPARMLLDNPQARYLGTHALMVCRDPQGGGSLQQAWELGEPALRDGELEQAARRTLQAAMAVGSLEDLAGFQAQLTVALGMEEDMTHRENVNPYPQEDISAEIVARITTELCPIDTALYDTCQFGLLDGLLATSYTN